MGTTNTDDAVQAFDEPSSVSLSREELKLNLNEVEKSDKIGADETESKEMELKTDMNINKGSETEELSQLVGPGADSVHESTELGKTNESVITMDTIESIEDSLVSDVDLNIGTRSTSGLALASDVNLDDSVTAATEVRRDNEEWHIAEERADELEQKASLQLSSASGTIDVNNGVKSIAMASPAPSRVGENSSLVGTPSPFRALSTNENTDATIDDDKNNNDTGNDNEESNEEDPNATSETLNFSASTASND